MQLRNHIAAILGLADTFGDSLKYSSIQRMFSDGLVSKNTGIKFSLLVTTLNDY